MSARRSTLLRAESGLTLPELILFIVVVSVGLVGVLSVLNLTAAKSSDPLVVKQAMAAADAVLEEITLKNFNKPAGGWGNPPAPPWTQPQRQLFDTVDDFKTGNFTWPAGIYSQTGVAVLPGLQGYSVTNVTVDNTVTTLPGIPAGDQKLITVTVTDPTGAAYSVYGYRTKY